MKQPNDTRTRELALPGKTVELSADQYSTVCHALTDRINRCEGWIKDAKQVGDMADVLHLEQQLIKAKDALAQVLRS